MINPKRQNIESILNKSVQYKVPDFQRDFEWKRENAEEFWLDLNAGEFFLGTFIFDVSTSGLVSIVDGQQRLTTIFILLAAIRDKAGENNDTDFVNAVHGKIAYAGRTGRDSKIQLITSDKIRDVFDMTIANSEWDGKTWDFRGRKRQVNRIKPIYDFFRGKIFDFDPTDLENLLNALYDSYSVVIEIEKTEEAFDIFERTNARGIELNAADLLKNYLFSKLDLRSEEIKQSWDTIVDRSNGNLLRMIKHFYVSKSGAITKRHLFRSIKVRGEEIGPQKLLEEIDTFSRHYSIVVNGTAESTLEWAKNYEIDELTKEYNYQQLNRSFDGLNLFSVAQSYPLFVKVMELITRIETEEDRSKAGKQLLKFVKSIENFHFINSAVSQKQANIVENFYSEVCKQNIDPRNVISFMNEVVTNLRKDKLATKEEFATAFFSLNYENDFTLIYYINDRLNDHYLDSSNPSKIYNPDKKILKKNHNIEHLISQDRSLYDFDIDDDLVHNIGNLIVVPLHLNSRLGNIKINKKLSKLNEEFNTLPEIKRLLDAWDEKDWDSYDQVQENINERARNTADLCYSHVFVM